MISGWIKWEKDLEQDPRVLRMVRALRNRCVTDASRVRYGAAEALTLVCGGLLRFWSYADAHIRSDDTIDLGFADIDELVGVEGFAEAMPDDWLQSRDDTTVELPGYQAHNSVVAKKRDLSQKRMERKRARDHHAAEAVKRNGSVTGASLDQTRPDQTKTNKNYLGDQGSPDTREEISNPPPRAKSLKVSRGADDPDWLFDLKLVMPERAGNQPWGDAVKAGNARIREGEKPEAFIAGAVRYAAFCQATGKLRTEHVMRASTFLGPNRVYLQAWDPPAARESAFEQIKRLNTADPEPPPADEEHSLEHEHDEH